MSAICMARPSAGVARGLPPFSTGAAARRVDACPEGMPGYGIAFADGAVTVVLEGECTPSRWQTFSIDEERRFVLRRAGGTAVLTRPIPDPFLSAVHASKHVVFVKCDRGVVVDLGVCRHLPAG